ncbi:hypothetical protein IMAU10379_02970 [Lactiplantibacillus plantarum]|nr:hypothetical protein [Lactiplantibacillus plantarum]
MRISKKIIISIGLLCFLMTLIFLSDKWTKQNISNLKIQRNSVTEPIVLVPGSNATQYRFDPLIRDINKREKTPHSLLRVLVHKNYTISYSGAIKKGERQPFIVIAFEDNKDGFKNIKKQAIWLKYALKYISQQYEFRKISLIGHSNGGLIITYALEHNLTSHYLTVQKVMTIAAPYNLNDSSVRSETELLENLIANRKYIPNSIDMYSLAGTQSYSNDGLVPLYSVLAGRYIYQKQVKHYTQITVSGVGAEHSDLPQNQQIIMAIEQYIEKW